MTSLGTNIPGRLAFLFGGMPPYLGALRPEQILKILELTDSFNLHREAVFIPLATQEHASVTMLPDGRLRIICPSAGLFDEWLAELRSRLEKMDLSKISH